MMTFNRNTMMLLASTMLSSFAFPTLAHAAETKASAGELDIPEVIVTGTRIEGAKTQEALPVSVVDSAQIAAIGSVSGDDLFRSLPQAGETNFQEARTTGNLNDARGDNASINLRSVGTGNTLVLINDRRMILTPGTQTENFVPVQTANTNSLPVGSISRIEVLRDGAGALYGSDAVAGVVNVITDKNFSGLRVQGRYGAADGTSEYTSAVKAGMNTAAGGNVMVFASYTHRTPLMASERSFSSSENHLDALTGTAWEGDTHFDNRSSSSPWGAFTALTSSGGNATVKQGTTSLTSSGQFHIEPISNTAAGCSSTTFDGNLCLRSGGITGTNDRVLRYDENPDRSIRGKLDRVNAFASFHQPVGAVELFGEMNFYHAVLDGQREQSAPISSAVMSVPASNYWNPFGAETINGVANPNRLPNLTGVPSSGLDLQIRNYRPVDTGPRTFTVTDDMIRGLLGVRGNMGDFKWESAITYAWARTDDNTHNAISNTLFQQQLALNTPDAYNPFNGGTDGAYSLGDATPNPAGSIAPFLVEVHRIGKTSLATGDFRLSNKALFSLPAGGVGFAAGIEWRHETFDDNRDPRLDGTITYTNMVSGITYGTDVMGASGAPDSHGSRSVAGAYAEFAVPLVSPDMNIPLINSLDLQLAGRFEHYSDFGDVAKPKVAALWEVFKGLRLRGSWSQSFRAPNLPQFYSDGTTVSNTRTDWAACRINGTTCSGRSTLEVRAGNHDLKPESSNNLSAGVVVQPFRWASASLDFWQIKSNGVIGIMGGQNQIIYDYFLRLNGSSNPNVVRRDPVDGESVGEIDHVADNYFNLGPRKINGLDFNLTLKSGYTDFGKFKLDVNVAKLLNFYQAPSAIQQELIDANDAGSLGSGIIITQAGDLIGQGGNPRWRWTANVTWNLDRVTAGILVNHVGSFYDTGTNVIDDQFYKVSGWTTVNGYIQLQGPDSGPLQGADFRLGVRNLFDKNPPLYSSNYGFNGALHSPTGRFIYFDVSKKF